MYRVLLVEDEEIELETLRDYIDWKKNGISRVFTARNGRTEKSHGRKSAGCYHQKSGLGQRFQYFRMERCASAYLKP